MDDEAQRARWWLWPPGREAHFRSIADGIPALIALMTPAGDVEIANRHALEYFGTTLAQLQRTAITDTVHPVDLVQVIAAQRQSVRTGQPYEVDGRHRRADGTYRWFHMHGFPLRDAQEQITLWYLLHTDIEDRKRAQTLLAAEKKILDMIVAGYPLPEILSALCGLVDENADGCFSSVVVLDRSGKRIAYAVAPGLPSSFTEALKGCEVTCTLGPCGMAIVRNEQVIAFDVTSDERFDREAFPAVAVAHGLKCCWSTPLCTLTGELLGTFAITKREAGCPTAFHQAIIQQLNHIASIAIQRTRSEEALDKLRSELTHVARVSSLGALTASIAHEVNQPLSGIITNAGTCLRMLASDPPNVAGAIETARRTIRDGHRAADIIARLRSLFVKKDAAAEAVDVNDAAREVIALSSSELQRSRVMLRPELADDLPRVTGDRVQLQQVILNLLRNAADAMRSVEDRPRRLVIRTQRDEDGCVRLTVTDAGAGIEPQALDRLFDAFYTTKSDGMGIGLSISRSIIERHRGRLWAAPNDDGPGTTFSFSIPSASELVTDAKHLTRSV